MGKWVGLAIVALVLVVGIANVGWCVIGSTLEGHWVSWEGGAVEVDWPKPWQSPFGRWHWYIGSSPRGPAKWAFDLSINRKFSYGVTVPLWLIALIPAVPTCWLWWRDRWRHGLCSYCRGNLAGLDAGALCPECGQPIVIGEGILATAKRWFTRRTAFGALVCFLIGAVINIAVAWAWVFAHPYAPAWNFVRVARIPNTRWPIAWSSDQGWWPKPYAAFAFYTAGATYETYHGWDSLPQAEFQMDIDAFGWPARSLRRMEAHATNSSITRFEGWPIHPSAPNAAFLLPIRPVGPGFPINSIVFAVPVASCWLAVLKYRRSYRRRHHLCIHCSYPVGDPAKPCSECGRSPAA